MSIPNLSFDTADDESRPPAERVSRDPERPDERLRETSVPVAERAREGLNGTSAASATPRGSTRRGRYDRLSPDEFVTHGERLMERGWHPIPLGDGKRDSKGKTLLEIGVTGHRGVDADSVETLRKWASKHASRRGGLNLGVRMPLGVIGIDVDCYDGKPGAETIAACETQWGKLPATWTLTARTDGSRKLFLRVPDGWVGVGRLPNGGVELLQRHLRYSVAPPSVHHSGNLVRAFGPDGKGCEQLPPPEQLPELPLRWLEGLRSDVEDLPVSSSAEGRELRGRFLGGEMAPEVVARINEFLTALADGASRHDACATATYALCALGAEQYAGVAGALNLVESAFVHAVASERGGEAVAREEFDRMMNGALRKVARNNPAASLTAEDVALAREAFAPGGVWHPDNPKGNVYYLHRRGQRADPPPQADGRQFTQSLAQVTPTKVRWLWHPWIPLGKLTIFEGEPDVGKSTMTLKLAAMVSNGGPWPRVDVSGDTSRNEKGLTDPAAVVLVGVEDDLADTVVPRLEAAKADLQLVSAMARPRDANGQPIPFLVPDDVAKLRRAIDEVDAKLVVIDPISAFMSDAVKPGSDTANRKALMTLADVAEQTGAAIVLVRHLNKGTGMSAKHRGGGSIAFTALARSVLLAAKLDPSEDRENTNATHALASTKGNLARAPKTMGYELRSSPSDPDSPVVRWAGVLEESADQLVGADGTKGDARTSAPARDEAGRLIREMLADGPRDAKEVRKHAPRGRAGAEGYRELAR
ncbi:hypothetical protein GOALK_016_01340 [Gordonia alkanivorans NBRC 16433]|uniref:DNA primase/polymerase bifunctional N-terminal domain-containing protein n=1 Tax=Gordonia alkanivorans NBRC 16433 TaxID=1027371 RepID=F9VQX2_9ACTN|nr:hypothetical protein GOALK_016_01340 [Gordonia alkanivorans NBRC 16433]